MGVRARRMVRRLGVDFDRRQPTLYDLLQNHQISVVLDVGANVGQHARRLRAWGYQGRIISFEPVDDAYRQLARRAARDRGWTARQMALGDQDGTALIGVSAASVFSSLRRAGSRLLREFSTAGAVHQQEAMVRRLDSLWPELDLGAERVMLKVDTQGYEREVLLGARQSLGSIYAVQLEASLQSFYEGEAAMPEMVRLMHEHAFDLVGLEPIVYERRTGFLMQADCVFFRREAVESESGAALPA